MHDGSHTTHGANAHNECLSGCVLETGSECVSHNRTESN